MPYVRQKKDGTVTAISPRMQVGYIEKYLPEDDPLVVAFRNPPPPTDEERIDSAFPQTDVARVIFEALFELTNRVRALEGTGDVTRAQLRDWLKGKLP